MRKFLFLVASAASVAACSASPETSAPTIGTTQQAIIKGKNSTTDQNAVVLIVHVDRTQGAFASCTGTLLAPNLLLTARHCVSNTTEEAFGCDAKGNLLDPSTGEGNPKLTNAGSDLSTTGFNIFTGTDRPVFFGGKVEVAAKGKKIYHDDAKVLCSHDLALLLLDRDIPNAPIMPVRLDAPPTEGETFTAVGWGVTQSTMSPSKRQQRAGIKILKVGPVEGSARKGEEPLPPNDFEVGEAICSGDSGGPAISESTGAVFGVVSRGGNNNANADPNDPAARCIDDSSGNVPIVTTNIYTKVAPFKDLILQAFEDSGHEPWIEGQPDPRLAKLDAECSANEECQSNLCVAGKCVQPCNASSDCSDGKECGTVDGSKMCKNPSPASPTSSSSGGCVAGATGPTGGLVPWALAGLASLVARRRRRAH